MITTKYTKHVNDLCLENHNATILYCDFDRPLIGPDQSKTYIYTKQKTNT